MLVLPKGERESLPLPAETERELLLATSGEVLLSMMVGVAKEEDEGLLRVVDCVSVFQCFCMPSSVYFLCSSYSRVCFSCKFFVLLLTL